MNQLDLENKKNRLLYRELFLKANEGFKAQINSLKVNQFCKNQKICCKVRYTGLSPAEIFSLSQEEDKISTEYVNLFIPYGAKENFNYEKDNSIDIKQNNDLASNVDKTYVNSILTKLSGPIYFYHCKYLDDNNKCTLTGTKSTLCNFPASVTTILPAQCGFREWQKRAIDKILNEISPDILKKLQDIESFRQTFKCKRTGTCCRLASSEFSYEELKHKAKNSDNFAGQFTSIFIPYDDIEEARKIFPEYIDVVESRLDAEEKIYFYHCPHITDENSCSIYEDRPQICRDFPNNPLAILPFTCGYNEWKDEVFVAAMLMHALIEIVEFNHQKIEAALKD
jgi:Fe-S-cluster containining protein